MSWLCKAPEGSGVVWMDHLVPFQASARVTWTSELDDIEADGGAGIRRGTRHAKELAGS